MVVKEMGLPWQCAGFQEGRWDNGAATDWALNHLPTTTSSYWLRLVDPPEVVTL